MATRFRLNFEQIFGTSAQVLAGGTLTFAISGGAPDQLQAIYQDDALSVTKLNPVTLDSAGKHGDIFLQAKDYRVILKDAAGIVQPGGDVDPVHGGSGDGIGNAIGDGVADDTDAVQGAIDGGKTIALGGKTYRITQRLIFGTAGQHIEGPGTLLYDGGINDRLLDVTADGVNFESVTFDGNNKQVFFGLTALRANTHNTGHIFCTFQNIKGHHLGGTLSLSECCQYAVIIDPNGTDFDYISCLFRDIGNDNTAAGVPGGAAVMGAGFCGAFFTYPSDGSTPPSVQGGSVAGRIVGCKFLRIDTVLDVGLTQAQLEQFSDADAIRFYGPTTNYDFFVDVDDCYFIAVGKRAVKGSGNGWMLTNSTIFAPSSMPYAMVNAITCDCSNATIRNVNCYGTQGKPIHIVLKTFDGFSINVDTLNCDYCDYFWQIGPSLATAVLHDYHAKGLHCPYVTLGGIVQTSPITAVHNWIVDDVDFTAAAGTHGIVGVGMIPSSGELWAAFGTIRLSGMQVKIGEQGLSGRLLDMTVDDASWVGSATDALVLEMGNTITTAANTPAGDPGRSSFWDTIILRINHIPNSYYSASRLVIASIYGNRIRVGRFELNLPLSLTTGFFPLRVYGHGVEIDELVEYGDHDISFMEFAKASFGPYKGSVLKSAVRQTKGEALNTNFLYCGNGQTCELRAVTDTSVTTAPCVAIADGTAAAGAAKAWMVGTVSHRSTSGTPIQDAGAKANVVASLVRAF